MAMRLGIFCDPRFQRLGYFAVMARPTSTAATTGASAIPAPTAVAASATPDEPAIVGAPVEPPQAKGMWFGWGKWWIPERKIPKMPAEFKEFPERDVKKFPHEELHLYPQGQVRMGLFPDSWFRFFYDKTGVTGPYLLGGGFTMFLLSKEIFPWIGPTKVVFISFALAAIFNRLMSHNTIRWVDKAMDADLKEVDHWEENLKKDYKDGIKTEAELQDGYKAMAEHMFVAKKENIQLQLEAAYRERLSTAHKEVKRRLDYLVQAEEAKRRFEQKHMVNWIVDEVKKSITPQQEQAYLAQCITDLKGLAPK